MINVHFNFEKKRIDPVRNKQIFFGLAISLNEILINLIEFLDLYLMVSKSAMYFILRKSRKSLVVLQILLWGHKS